MAILPVRARWRATSSETVSPVGFLAFIFDLTRITNYVSVRRWRLPRIGLTLTDRLPGKRDCLPGRSRAGRNRMDSERLISLKVEAIDHYNLVSSPEFPLLHLSIEDDSYEEIETCVLPILKEMIERKHGRSVTL